MTASGRSPRIVRARPGVRRRAVTAAALGLVLTRAAAAQLPTHDADRPRASMHVILGGYVAAGPQRRTFDSAALIGGQVGLRLQPRLAVVGGVAVAQMTDRGLPADGEVNLLQYDVGVELERASLPWAGGVTPFVGLGAGGRSYDYRASGIATRSSAAAYVALGGERRFQRTGLRIEARTYVPRGAGARADDATRFDVLLLAGLAYHFR